MQEQSDLALITRAAAGDMRSFRVLVEKHQSMAYSVAFRFLNNQHDSQDVLQEAFVRIWKNISNYRPEIKFSTWLYKIVTNLCLDVLKSKIYKQARASVSTDNAENLATYNDPLTDLERVEFMEAIHNAANDLTPKQKSVFVLRDLQGFPSREVEEILSMNSGAVKSNLYHARTKMCQLLNNHYRDFKTEEL